MTDALTPEAQAAQIAAEINAPEKPDHLATITAYRANAEQAAAQALANHHMNHGAAQAFAAVLNLLAPKEG